MGYLVKRKEGVYLCVVFLGQQRIDGKVKEQRVWRTVRGTRKEAERVLRQLEEQHARGKLAPTRELLGDYLRRWLAEVAPRTAGPTTLESYRMIVNKHLIPHLGGVRIDRLTPVHINGYLGKLLTSGRRAGGGAKGEEGLAAETVRRHYRVLHKALQDAVAMGVLLANPAARPHVILPRRHRAEMRTLTEPQVLRFLDAAQTSRLAALYELAIFTGMRQGELLGLRWQDVNLDLGMLSVRQIYYRGLFKAPKTERSRRTVELDAHLVDVLRAHRDRQQEERRLFGDEYQDHDLVFCQPDGRPLDGQSLARNEFRRLLRQAGCPRIRFHDLRHTCATWHGQMGTPLKVISDLLGHSSVAITGDLYAHAVRGLQQQATARLTGRLQTLRTLPVTGAPAAATAEQPVQTPLEAPAAPADGRLQPPVH